MTGDDEDDELEDDEDDTVDQKPWESWEGYRTSHESGEERKQTALKRKTTEPSAVASSKFNIMVMQEKCNGKGTSNGG